MLPKWDLDAERDASEFHAGYCGRLLEKALKEVTFVLLRDLHNRLPRCKKIFIRKLVRGPRPPHLILSLHSDYW